MSYTFLPLRDYPQSGVVVPNQGKPRAAEYLTPGEAKQRAKRKAQRLAG